MDKTLRSHRRGVLANRRGAAFLLSVYLVSLTLLLLGGVSLQRTNTEVHSAEVSRDLHQAFWLAEGGLDQGLTEMETNGLPSLAANECTSSTSNGSVISEAQMSYRFCKDAGGQSRIEATGTALGKSTTLKATVQEAAVLQFPYLAYADEIFISGNSATGGMDTNSSTFLGNTTGKGELATPNTIPLGGPLKRIHVFSGSTVRGDIYVGQGGDPSQLVEVEPGATFTGGFRNLADGGSVRDLPPITIPPGATDLGLTLTLGVGERRCLSPGQYVATDVYLQASSELCTTGDVELYVTRYVDILEGSEVYGQRPGSAPYTDTYSPKNLRIVSTASGIGGIRMYGALVAATIYAPRAPVHFGPTKFVGGLIAWRLIVDSRYDSHNFPTPLASSGLFLYDEALRSERFSLGGTSSTSPIKLWSSE